MYDPEPAESFCIVDGHYGIYVPQSFAERYDMNAWHVSPEDAEILLAGPDHEFYWDAWSDVLDDAYFEKDGKRFSLEQDSDLFAVRYGEEQMPIHKVIRRIGDINPLDYDGGFAYLHFETGKPEIEMYLLDDPENDDTEKDEYTVYSCLVEDPGDWVDWDAVARSCGTKAEDYVNAFLRNDQDHMICAIEDAAGYYGWFEFDQYPLKLTRAEAEERISRLFGRKYA